jgi:molybdopterin-containing oxidoreductase family iron-sulfur binding subunit
MSQIDWQKPAAPKLWRSLEQLETGPRQEREAVDLRIGDDGWSRRDFLTLVGMATVAGCFREPPEKIMPYSRQPAEVKPGVPLHYATSVAMCDDAMGLVATCYEGRPVKLEGNEQHPSSIGSTGAIEQALLAQLYDPERARAIREKLQAKSWRAFLTFARNTATRLAKGRGLHFLVQPDGSPLLASLRAEILKALPETRFWAWEPLSLDNVYEGARMAFGKPMMPRYAFDRAEVIVSLDADFLERGPGWISNSRDFTSHRTPERMNRLYVVETTLSLTGMMADHRRRATAAEIAKIASDLFNGKGDAWTQAVARDLKRAAGRGIVIAGMRQPPEIHELAHALNDRLGNAGKTVAYGPPPVEDVRTNVDELAREVTDGHVDTLVISAWNPALSAPALPLGKVPHVVYTALYEDETAERSEWFVPEAHPLESWGDTRAFDGTVGLRQPLVNPLFGGYALSEIWAAFLGEGFAGKNARQLLREYWSKQKMDWDRSLQDGIVAGTETKVEMPSVIKTEIAVVVPPHPFELHFLPDAKLWDGRYREIGWLQELPDPVTKVTWDSPLLVSVADAKKMGLSLGDVVRVEANGKSITAPVYVLPGHADGAVSIAAAAAYPIRTSPWVVRGATITKTGETAQLAITQDHDSMEGRPLALETSLAEWKKHPGELVEDSRKPLPTMYEPWKYTGYRWAMGIDLARCTGCSACVVACEAENNSPVVGKERVERGREMQWLRIDRYFTGEPDDAGGITQPVMCVHCEFAPCEYVCPVNATVHSDEGLNEMVYNRCVGTRYCSNNCPYKVRRFNYFNYVGTRTPTERMLANPEVTVRSRGVMEKCTYCVQRIERVRIDSRIAGREIHDGEIKTACQQACPTRAIMFGSLHDPNAQVTRWHDDERAYALLHELNTRPRTRHLARIKNLNPEIPA